MPKTPKQNNKGFALLFSVLLASFLLTIGLSIFSIALKELAISTAARQSVRAFFAADSGRECAIYWDIKAGVVTSKNRGGEKIKCWDSEITMTSGNENGPWYSTIPSSITDDPSDNVFLTDDGQANFNVEITKTETGNNIITTIISRGYDSDSDDRVERAIRQTY